MSLSYRFLRIAAFCGLATLGCSHETESPKPAPAELPAAVRPDLICVEQLTTNVSLKGKGFTPMPSKTLEGGPELLLPKIELTRTLAINGSPAAGSIVIPDSAGDPTNSLVQWQSEQQMSFDVTPELTLEPGLYDVTITNPDGKGKAQFPGSLVGVPRPTASGIAPDILCNAQHDQTVVISGTDFLSVGGSLPTIHIGDEDLPATSVESCKDVPGVHAAGPVQTCTSVTFVIPVGTFEAGNYDVTVTNPETAACSSTDALAITVVPPPSVAKIQPDLTCNAQGDRKMTVTGADFLQIGDALPTIQLGDQTYPTDAIADCEAVTPGPFTEGSVDTCRTIHFTIPKGSLAAGDYVVGVTNPKPADCESVEMDVKLHVAPPPTTTTIAADLVCSAQSDQPLTLTGSGFLAVGDALPTVTIGDQVIAASSLGDCSEVPGMFEAGIVQACNTLQLDLLQGALEPGDYAVVVINPDPAGCHSEELLNLHVAAPPKIAALGAGAICDAQADQVVVINGSALLQVGTALPQVQVGDEVFDATSANGCTVVAGSFAEGPVSVCTSIQFTVPKGTFPPGDYPVSVTNPAPADCFSSETVTLHVDPPPTVTNVNPTTVCAGGRSLTITGTGFIPTPDVSLTAAGKATIVANSVGIGQAGTQLTAQIGAGAEIGTTYDLVVTNPDSCTDVAPHKQVTVVAGPIVYLADPEVVYNGVNTRVTVYATGLIGGVNSVSIVPAGQTSPVTNLTWVNVPGRPNRGQVVIPKGQAPGTYDLTLTDTASCLAILPNALQVTGSLTVSLASIDPPFGWTQSETAVTIKRDTADANGKPFVATPRAFLNPSNPGANDVAIPLEAVSFVDGATLTAVVPKGQPASAYDLIVVNPDGSVGLLASAFTIQQLAPPLITAATPASIVSATGQVVKVAGTNFRASTISLACVDNAGVPLPAPSVVSAAESCTPQQNCTQSATIDGSPLPSGSVCVLRLTNSDESYVDFSAIGVTNSSLNLGDPKVGTDMVTGRRALAAASGDATTAARFVYAIGGDGGEALKDAPFDSLEYAPVDLFGAMGAWRTASYTLDGGRSFAASAKLGRYIYLMGGSDGTTALNSVTRGMILSPREVPSLDVDDIVPNAQGLDAGYWFYRVSAVFSAADLDNPSGESLPSDEFVVKVPSFPGKKIQVVLKWSAPLDALGAALPNVTGYRVYRSAAVDAAPGSEVLLEETAALTFTDNGTFTPGTAKPLMLGDTGQWATLPTLGQRRMGAAGAIAPDPATPGTFYVYALSGLDGNNAELASYEFLTLKVAGNGHQTVQGTWTAGANALNSGRWQLGAWVADVTTSPLIAATDTFVYAGGGIDAARASVKTVEAGKVLAGGDLGTINNVPLDFNNPLAGYGVCSANGQLFTFGGAQAAFSSGATSAKIGRVNPPIAPPALAPGAWNGGALTMTQERYLLGSSVQSSFIFLVGGQTATDAASRTTELVIW